MSIGFDKSEPNQYSKFFVILTALYKDMAKFTADEFVSCLTAFGIVVNYEIHSLKMSKCEFGILHHLI